LTQSGKWQLRLRFHWADGEFAGRWGHVTYNNFEIASETENFKLTVGDSVDHSYMPNGRVDAFSGHNGLKFSTSDKDPGSSSCAATYKGAWWFSGCFSACLNCVPDSGNRGTNGDVWYDGKAWRIVMSNDMAILKIE
jgi:ficolin